MEYNKGGERLVFLRFRERKTGMANLTVSDIATREHVSIDTVKRALKHGHLKGHKIGTRGDWRIAVEDYQAWLSAGAHTNKLEEKPNDRR